MKIKSSKPQKFTIELSREELNLLLECLYVGISTRNTPIKDVEAFRMAVAFKHALGD